MNAYTSTHTHSFPTPLERELQAWHLEQHAKHLREAASSPSGGSLHPECPYCNPNPTATEPWSEMDIAGLTNEIAHGRSMAETASFLCRDEDEVRQKARELGLTEHPGERVKVDR
jgi:hypothetical protein